MVRYSMQHESAKGFTKCLSQALQALQRAHRLKAQWYVLSNVQGGTKVVILCRAPRAAEVQRASVALVKRWGKQKGALAVKEEQRESERFFSQTFEPMLHLKHSSHPGAATQSG